MVKDMVRYYLNGKQIKRKWRQAAGRYLCNNNPPRYLLELFLFLILFLSEQSRAGIGEHIYTYYLLSLAVSCIWGGFIFLG